MSELVTCPRCNRETYRNWCYLCDRDKRVSPELAAAYQLMRESDELSDENFELCEKIYRLRVDVGDLQPTPEEHENWRSWFFVGSSRIRKHKKTP